MTTVYHDPMNPPPQYLEFNSQSTANQCGFPYQSTLKSMTAYPENPDSPTLTDNNLEYNTSTVYEKHGLHIYGGTSYVSSSNYMASNAMPAGNVYGQNGISLNTTYVNKMSPARNSSVPKTNSPCTRRTSIPSTRLFVRPGCPTPSELCVYDNKLPSGLLHVTDGNQTVEFLNGVANMPNNAQ